MPPLGPEVLGTEGLSSTHGKTPEKALENLEEVQAAWIEDCLERGDPIPMPEAEERLPSGKWVQRVPRSLHRDLIRLAKREKVSLNQFVTSILSEAVGARKPKAVAPFRTRRAAMPLRPAARKTSTASTT